MPPDLQPSGRHQHMFLQGLSSEGILLGGENHRSFILKLCEFVQESTLFMPASGSSLQG